MVFILAVLAWVSIAMLIAWVVEPFLRLRYNFLLAEDVFDREVVKFGITVLWPILLPIFLFARFIVFPIINIIKKMEEKSNDFWERKPEVASYQDINESKSDYRSISFKD